MATTGEIRGGVFVAARLLVNCEHPDAAVVTEPYTEEPRRNCCACGAVFFDGRWVRAALVEDLARALEGS